MEQRKLQFRFLNPKSYEWIYFDLLGTGFRNNFTLAEWINTPKFQNTGLLIDGKELYEGAFVRIQSNYDDMATDETIDCVAMVLYAGGSFYLDFHGMILNPRLCKNENSNWTLSIIDCKVLIEGDKFLCIGEGFENLQESENYAFGNTKHEAVQSFLNL